MPRVPVHTLDSAPADSQAGLKSLEQKYGTVLNIFGEMAHAPAMLNGFIAAETTIADYSSLNAATREAIHLTVAAVNDCSYCQAAYTMAAKSTGFDDEQAKAIRAGEASFDVGLQALLAVAREIAGNKGFVADATWQRALDMGWSQQQLMEAFADTVRGIMTNYFNHFVGTESDLPAAPALDR